MNTLRNGFALTALLASSGCDAAISEASLHGDAARIQPLFQSCINGNADNCDRAKRDTQILHQKATAFCSAEPKPDSEFCGNLDNLAKMVEAIDFHAKVARGEIPNPMAGL